MIPAVGNIHVEAFAGYMNARLGTLYINAFLNWFLMTRGSLALAAVDVEGEIVGYVLGAPLDYGKSMNRDLLPVAAFSIMMRPWLIFSKRLWRIIVERLRSSFGFSPGCESRFEFPQPAMSLVAIGVASSARGKQVGSRLLRAFHDKARERQIRSLQLTVYAANVVARRLYESHNWSPVQQGNSVIEYVRILDDDSRPGASRSVT
jgi:ribosomal protein S18 acetylase RimI-like enzyme